MIAIGMHFVLIVLFLIGGFLLRPQSDEEQLKKNAAMQKKKEQEIQDGIKKKMEEDLKKKQDAILNNKLKLDDTLFDGFILPEEEQQGEQGEQQNEKTIKCEQDNDCTGNKRCLVHVNLGHKTEKICCSEENAVNDRYCMKDKKAGEPCADASQCMGNLNCQSKGQSGPQVCTKQESGAICYYDTDCYSGLCDYIDLTFSKTEFKTCINPWGAHKHDGMYFPLHSKHCQHDFQCTFNKCENEKCVSATGFPCDEKNKCQSDSICVTIDHKGTKCVKKDDKDLDVSKNFVYRPKGESCAFDQQCYQTDSNGNKSYNLKCVKGQCR